MGHARAPIGVPNPIEKAKEIFEKKLSVRDVEAYIRGTKSKIKKMGSRPQHRGLRKGAFRQNRT